MREIFEEVDEEALLDQAIARKLRGTAAKDLDDKGKARIVRSLAGQGFRLDAVLKRLKLQ